MVTDAPVLKPAMPAALREIAARAKERHRERWAPPRIAVEGIDWDSWAYQCPYREEDRDDWEAVLFEAFGTRSASVVRVFLAQLGKLCGKSWDDAMQEWRPSLDEFNAMLAIIASTEPANESQAAIAAQMVQLHFRAMQLSEYPDERSAATVARLLKTYASHARTLQQLQGRSATRHDTHVYYYDQRQQALVMQGSDHGTDVTGTGAPMLREVEAVRPALPSASSARQTRVPHSWWGARIWSALRTA